MQTTQNLVPEGEQSVFQSSLFTNAHKEDNYEDDTDIGNREDDIPEEDNTINHYDKYNDDDEDDDNDDTTMSTAGIAKRTMRKVSWRVLPLIGFVYSISSTEKLSISLAADGIIRDLYLNARQFGFIVSIYFLTVCIFIYLLRIGKRHYTKHTYI